MKKIWFRKSFWQSVLSALVFGVFVYFALGSFGTSQQTTHLGDGVYEMAKYYSNGQTEVLTGRVDKYGKWHGQIKIENEISMDVKKTEIVNMVHGLRHGESRISLTGYPDEIHCYNMGERVDCEKSAYIISTEHSGYEIMSYKYPWFMSELNASGFDNEYVEGFVDTVETLMATYEFEAADFDDYYDDAISVLEHTYLDSIIVLNVDLSIFQGLELLKNSELRMAVVDCYKSGETSTFDRVKESYSNYLLQLNNFEVTDPDFKGFCQVFDSVMTSYSFLDPQDPFLLDSLDNRMYLAMDYISSNEESSLQTFSALKSAFLINKNESIGNIYKKVNPILKQMLLDSSPKNVAEIVMSLMLLEFNNADMIRNSVKEAYLLNNSITTLPTVTTEITAFISNTSVNVKGYVLEDGGAEVTARGIAWGTAYNPEINNQIKAAGIGMGSFETVIDGLIQGQTYYVRTYATNSAGTAYGNCLSFVPGTVGVEDVETNDSDFNVYPNPASDVITFSFWNETAESMVLTIINLKGQVVLQKDLGKLQQGENKIQLDLSGLENGIYNSILKNDIAIVETKNFVIAR